MSFLKNGELILEGDTVILYLSIHSMHAIDVTPTIKNKKGEAVPHIFQTPFGSLKVENLVGARFGSRVDLSKGWAYVLRPTPELWSQTLPHRTQIIYTPDTSMILFQLDIRPGSCVVESGTGSGSLSHYFLRAVKPHGHLHTFDFHEARANQAREEFQRHGLGDYVTVYHRDVCQNGFDEQVDGKADAIFLDLPAPQLAVPYAVKALKSSGGRFCSFSPCIEQSQRVCEALAEHGFIEVQSMEILQEEQIIKTRTLNIMDFDFLKEEKPSEKSDLQTVTLNESIDKEPNGARNRKEDSAKTPKETKKYMTTFAPPTLPGHTGYLTFATLPMKFE